jgi:transketolase
MFFTEIKASSLTRLGQAGSIFSIGAYSLKRSGKDIFLITADYGNPSGMTRFKTEYQESFLNVGIAEQNMIGIAAGLADSGLVAIAGAQACFVSMRSFEQVRQYMGYMKIPLILVGVSSGFALTFFGNTHYALEDYGILSTIPGINIYTPSDGLSALKALELAIESRKPSYIRTTGTPYQKPIYKRYSEINKTFTTLSQGKTILVISSGSITREVSQAINEIKDGNLFFKHIDVLKAFPITKNLIKQIEQFDSVFVVEEHCLETSLGIKLQALSGKKIQCINTGNKFHKVGDYNYLLKSNNLNSASLKKIFYRKLTQII